jgi:tRNA pseudouridine13 synthase
MENTPLEGFNNLKELDVGITEYICKETVGFNCVLKHRYSDFLVNEIDLNGNVVWIKSNEDKDKNNNSTNISSTSNKDNLTEDEINKIFSEKFSKILNEGEISKFKDFLYKYLEK